ncbi:MAG: imelysin family protein [Pseudomonadota bacterium]
MRRLLLCLAIFASSAMSSAAQADDGTVSEAVIHEHVLPGFETLEAVASELSAAAARDCAPTSPALRAAFHAAFDAWVSVSHLRFGPTEADNRAFALAFWPDPRGKTPKALAQLARDEDPVAFDPEEFRAVSVAARGFYALERLLYAPPDGADAAYLCALTVAVAADIADNSAAIHLDWRDRYAALAQAPFAPDGPYRSDEDVLRALYTALNTGLQFTSELRLERPLGTAERPRPRRAEARLSVRSLRHVELSLTANRALAAHLSAGAPELAARLSQTFDVALEAAERIDDPAFATVDQPLARLRVEALQQRVDETRALIRQELGAALGVAEGFNALDGD